MANREKRQHYVPQGYLRRFKNANSNEKVARIWVYDKVTEQHFSVPIQTVASGEGFYDSQIDDYIEKYPERGMEKLLGEQEIEFYKHLKSLDESVREQTEITLETKTGLAFYIYLQFIRTSKFRSGLKLRKDMVLPDGVQPDDYGKITQIYGFSDKKMMAKFMDLCLSKVWIVYESPDNFDIPTSDNPVIFDFEGDPSMLTKIIFGEHVFSQNIIGLKIIFPLDPKHVLFLYDKGTKPELEELNGKVVSLDIPEFSSLISKLCSTCERQIFMYDTNKTLMLVEIFMKVAAVFAEKLDPITSAISEITRTKELEVPGVNNYSNYRASQKAQEVFEVLLEAVKPKTDK